MKKDQVWGLWELLPLALAVGTANLMPVCFFWGWGRDFKKGQRTADIFMGFSAQIPFLVGSVD